MKKNVKGKEEDKIEMWIYRSIDRSFFSDGNLINKKIRVQCNVYLKKCSTQNYGLLLGGRQNTL
jgi:hypothetical protein